MSRNIYLLGTLAVLLLIFGCAGRGYQAPAQPPAQQPSAPSQSAIAIGDSDIAPQPEQNESDTLSNEDVVPADSGSAGASGTPAAGTNGTGNMTSVSGAATNLSDSDLSVSGDVNESDLISQEDVVGPP